MASTEGVLRIVHKHFPNVKTAIDAQKNLSIEVTISDEKTSKRRNMSECAMAVACKRAYKADGVILARSVAYLIKGNLAVRFRIPPSVAREITSFDRGAGFTPGTYQLSKPTPKMTLDYKVKTSKSPGGSKGDKGIRIFRHTTTGIRAVLGSVDDKG